MATLEFTRAPADSEGASAAYPALTVEAGLYAALFLMALVVRLLYIGAAPLAADEAAQALASWHFVRGIADPFTGSPLLFTGNAVVFALFGATDTSARLLPALLGSMLVLLPALVRRQLGRLGALIASALLVISPSLVFFSRDLNAVVPAAACALGGIIFFLRYTERRVWPDLYLSVALAALALISAPDIWTIVLALALASLAVRYVFHRGSEASVAGNGDALGLSAIVGERQMLRRLAVLFVVVLVGVGTTFLLHRDGVGAAFDLFGAWLSGFRPGGSAFDPLRALIVYEPISLFIGAAALVDWFAPTGGAVGRNRLSLVLVFWAVVAFVVYSIGSDKNPSHVVTIAVPLALLAGRYLGAKIRAGLEDLHYTPDGFQTLISQGVPVYAFALALSIFLYLVLAEYATRGSVLAAELLAPLFGMAQGTVSAGLNNLAIAAVIILVAGAISILAISTVGQKRAGGLGLAVIVTLLTLWTIRQTALASFSETLDVQELLVQRATSPNVRDLVSDLEDISRWRANDSHTLAVIVDKSLGPVVEWSLRDFVNARLEPRPTVNPGTEALLLPSNAPVNSSGLISQHYQVEATRNTAPVNFLQWLLFRQGAGVDFTDVTLWIPQPK